MLRFIFLIIWKCTTGKENLIRSPQEDNREHATTKAMQTESRDETADTTDKESKQVNENGNFIIEALGKMNSIINNEINDAPTSSNICSKLNLRAKLYYSLVFNKKTYQFD